MTQNMPTKILADRLEFVVLKLTTLIRMVLRVGSAIRKLVVLVGLLRVSVRSDLSRLKER